MDTLTLDNTAGIHCRMTRYQPGSRMGEIPRAVRALRDRLTRAHDRGMDDEMRFHLEMEIRDRIAGGATPEEAKRTALRDFGGVERYKEEGRAQRPFAWLAELRQDLSYGLRLMRRAPGFTVSAILVTALGIGATTAIFSVVSGVLVRPLPFAAPDRLASLRLRGVAAPDEVMMPSPDAYTLLQRATQVIEAIAAYSPSNAALVSGAEPEQLRVENVTASMFPLLGVRPILGRTFLPGEDQAPDRVAVLSHDLWRRQFGLDSAVIGRTILLDGVGHTIVGVMPEHAKGALLRGPAIWLPLKVDRQPLRGVNSIVRVRDGVSIADAQAWINRSLRLQAAGSADSVATNVQLTPLATQLTGDVRRPLLVLLGAVIFVLALVGANIATLLLARTASRGRELAVRRALGATRRRQVRQLLTESLLLASLGGLLGVLLARWSIGALRTAGGGVLPRLDAIVMDWRVLAFSVAIICVTGVGAGLAPAFAAGRADPADAFRGTRSEGTGPVRWGGIRGSLVVAQIGLSVCLLIGAGLMIKSFLTLMPTAPGFDTANRLAISVRLDRRPTYDAGGPARRLAFVRDVTRQLEAIPGVEDVAATSFIPLVMMSGLSEVSLIDDSAPERSVPREAHHRAVTANYFSTMNIPLRRGRAFTATDRDGASRVAIVNESAARKWWPERDPLGKRIRFTEAGRQTAEAVVVGIVGDVRFSGRSTRSEDELFVPYEQMPYTMMTFIVRTNGDPKALAPLARAQVWSVDPQLPIDRIAPLTEIASDSVAVPRFYSVLLGAFALVALVLALAGIYSVLAYTVSRRQREIGIRVALGAHPRRVQALIVGEGMALAIAGIMLGAGLARLLTGVLEGLIREVSPTDPTVFAVVLALLAVAAFIACAIPARRASRVDPLVALRMD